MTAPMFWHNEGQQQAQKLPDVKSSDRKAKVLLRRLRTGGSSKKTLVVIPSSITTGNDSPLVQSQQEEDEVAVVVPDRSATSTPSLSEASETETASSVADSADSTEEPPPVLPAYVAAPTANERPPPYVGAALPPALPGYTPLPLPGIPSAQDTNNPARDLKQPSLGMRRSYRDVLRRRMASTRRLFGSDSAAGGPETQATTVDHESGRGVVMYRDAHDRWVDAGELDEIDDIKFMQAKQTGLKGWLRRAWVNIKEFMEEHPMLFFVALFVIIVVALCVLI